MRFLTELFAKARALAAKLAQAPATQAIAGALARAGAWLLALITGKFLEGYEAEDFAPLGRLRAFLKAHAKHFEKNEGYPKLRLSAALVMLAGLMTVFTPRTPMALVCIGMGMSFFGDAMLMQYPPISRRVRQYFLWGMGFFAGAQVLYVCALRLLFAQMSGTYLWPLRLIIAVFSLCSLIVIYKPVMFNLKQPKLLRVGATFYAILVSATAGSGVAVCFASAGRGWPLMLGGLLFLLSDMLIALGDFGKMRLEYRDAWVWLTYVPAQALLIIGTAMLA